MGWLQALAFAYFVRGAIKTSRADTTGTALERQHRMALPAMGVQEVAEVVWFAVLQGGERSGGAPFARFGR